MPYPDEDVEEVAPVPEEFWSQPTGEQIVPPPASVMAGPPLSRAAPPGTHAWAWAPPGHLPGEPAVPIPDMPPGLDMPVNERFKLPSGVVGFRQTTEEHDRLAQLDQQAKQARIAAEQSYRDAKMFDEMRRVARSTKDIEAMLKSIDVQGYEADVRAGMSPIQAAARRPRMFGAGFGSVLKAAAPQPKATWMPPTGAAGGPPGHFQLPGGGVTIPPGSNQETMAQKEIAASQKLRAEAEQARAAGDAKGFQDKTRQAELLETHIAPKGVVSQLGYDDQGRPIMTTSIGGQPTVATQSTAQQKQISYEIATEGINDILGRLRSSDIGVAGVAGENVFDRWLGQLDPKLVSGQRVSNRRALGALRENLYTALSPERIGGTGFSNKDAERLKEMASSLEAGHSYNEVVTTLRTMQDIIKDRARVFAERTGQPIPDFAKTSDMIQEDYVKRLAALRKAVSNSTMTKEQAEVEANELAQRTADNLRRFHGIKAKFK